jgi:hypothetical protein
MSSQNINISAKNISGKCDLKCAYNFSYTEINSTAKNNNVMIKLTPDNSAIPPVTYNTEKYNVSTIYITSPSLHTFNDKQVNAEIFIQHVPVKGGQNLNVAIPIISSSESSTASNLITQIIQNVSTNAPRNGESTNLNISGFTLQNIIPSKPFFSYTDTDGFVYGFDIISLYNLILKCGKDEIDVRNPYNRNIIQEEVVQDIHNLIRISKKLKNDIIVDIPNVETTTQKSFELKILDVFQAIDSLGNYSDPSWFLSLSKNQCTKFIRELFDIWNYRAQLTNEVKRNICPPIGDLFNNINLTLIQSENNVDNIKKLILPILEKLVYSGIDQDSKSLGAYYILGSLTLVNSVAADSLPWLYQSFTYFN